MGSWTLSVAQMAFKEDPGHWNDNEGLLVTHFTFLLEKLSFWEPFFFTFQKIYQ